MGGEDQTVAMGVVQLLNTGGDNKPINANTVVIQH